MWVELLEQPDAKVHFIGIGGIGMSGLAAVLKQYGCQVSGSDISASKMITRLSQANISINIGHEARAVNQANLVVVSSAIQANNPELIAAKEKKLPIIHRGELLAYFFQKKIGIAIAGAHGKTTTSSLLTHIFIEAGFDPSYFIGGILQRSGNNAKLTPSQIVIAEADESDASFLHLKSKMAVITNIDSDHMQTYQNDLEKLKQCYYQFLENVDENGIVAYCADDLLTRPVVEKLQKTKISYGFSALADFQIIDYKQIGMQSEFMIKYQGQVTGKIILNLPGKYSALNATACFVLAKQHAIAESVIIKALKTFSGVGRRLQSYGEFEIKTGRVLLMEDYGHHPREIEVTMEALKNAMPGRRIIHVFQPHRFSRTKDLFDDFARVLAKSENLVLMDIYSAGEDPIKNIDLLNLANKITSYAKNNLQLAFNSQALLKILETSLKDRDVILMQGAGSVGALANKMAAANLDFSKFKF